jgi:cysteine-rich repeat protein
METIASLIDDATDGLNAIINGNVVHLHSADITQNSAILYITGEAPICGDGVIEGTEECDDGGLTPGDGCDSSCEIESGWTCWREPSVCTELPAVPSMSATGVTVLSVAVLGIGVLDLIIAARRRRG